MANRGKRIDRYNYWTEHIHKWKKSGLSQADYCRKSGLDARHFSLWKSKLKRDKKSKQKRPAVESKAQFIEVDLEKVSSDKNCRIELENALGEQFKIHVNHDSAVEYIDFMKVFLSKTK